MKNKAELNFIYKNAGRFLPAIILRSLIACASSLSLLSFALFSGRVLDIATGAQKGNSSLYIALLFVSIGLYIALIALGSHLSVRIDGKVRIAFQKKLFRSVCTKHSDFEEELHSGDMLNRFTEDVGSVTAGVTGIIPSVVSFVSKIAVGLGAMLVMSPSFSLIFIGAGILFPLLGRLVSQKFKYLHKQMHHSAGVTRSFLQECFANMTVIKSFSAADSMEERLGEYQEVNFGYKIKRNLLHIVTHTGIYSVFTIAYYIALVWGASQISLGLMTYGTLMAMLQIMNQLRHPLQSISGIVPSYLSMIASAERLMDIEGRPEEPSVLSGEELDRFKEEFSSIEAKDICFSYKNKNIFNKASFTINKGDTVAITGRSGMGKTTLFRLLLSLIEIDSGSLAFNGAEPITAAHRSMFAFVPQGNMILSGTIRENIAFAHRDIDDSVIENAAKAAGIFDYITSLPKGFDTLLSERGAGLSEGQIQRIAIARALVTDAPILLLDECSSALDEKTEKDLLERLQRMTDKTIIFITHRKKVLSICNKQIDLGQ